MQTLAYLLYRALDIYFYIVIAAVLMSWLVAFDVINLRNKIAARITQGIIAMTEPAFDLFRRILPPIGGLDLAPFGVIIVISLLQSLLLR
ncbi:MAG TPA: YggT family protein [Rhodospirillaceae bacterium]|nr:MAG: hypothetical protein A2018_03805 [Alphaproteobacteria bacterium GWF2_58_20]HAU29723.1 YggT family protein [Rhodospirillaceae bacterium]